MTYDADEIAAVFGRAAPDYDTVIPFFSDFGARLVEVAALHSGESVLDVGSGRGATLLPAAERVGPTGRVVGVDLSEEMVTLLQSELTRRGLRQAAVRRMDAEALDVETAAFDAVLSSFVLHLLPEPERAAAEMARVLRPVGRCVVATPSGFLAGWDFLGRIFGEYARRAGRPLVMPFRPSFDPGAVLAGAGLDVARTTVEQVEFAFADEQEWWRWAWSHGMRGLLEVLEPPVLDSLRDEMFAELAALRTDAGILMAQSATFVVAHKPG